MEKEYSQGLTSGTFLSATFVGLAATAVVAVARGSVAVCVVLVSIGLVRSLVSGWGPPILMIA